MRFYHATYRSVLTGFLLVACSGSSTTPTVPPDPSFDLAVSDFVVELTDSHAGPSPVAIGRFVADSALEHRPPAFRLPGLRLEVVRNAAQAFAALPQGLSRPIRYGEELVLLPIWDRPGQAPVELVDVGPFCGEQGRGGWCPVSAREGHVVARVAVSKGVSEPAYC